MSNQDEELKTKSPEEIQLIKVNEKLGKLISLNVEGRNLATMACCLLYSICNYKEEQKKGDKTSRTRQEIHNKKSTRQGWWGVGIALTALYISIFGADNIAVLWLRSLM